MHSFFWDGNQLEGDFVRDALKGIRLLKLEKFVGFRFEHIGAVVQAFGFFIPGIDGQAVEQVSFIRVRFFNFHVNVFELSGQGVNCTYEELSLKQLRI